MRCARVREDIADATEDMLNRRDREGVTDESVTQPFDLVRRHVLDDLRRWKRGTGRKSHADLGL